MRGRSYDVTTVLHTLTSARQVDSQTVRVQAEERGARENRPGRFTGSGVRELFHASEAASPALSLNWGQHVINLETPASSLPICPVTAMALLSLGWFTARESPAPRSGLAFSLCPWVSCEDSEWPEVRPRPETTLRNPGLALTRGHEHVPPGVCRGLGRV